MEEETRKEFLELLQLLDEGRLQEFKEKASECPPVDIAEGLEEVEDGGRVLRVFRMLPKDISSDVFSYMTSEQQQLIAESATNAELKALVDYWHGELSGLTVNTPDANFNSMINTWNAFQCFTTFVWSRAASLIYCGQRNGLGYRTDWAEAVGITEAPKTVEDVYDMLYKFTYDDPDGNGANDTYGLEMCKYTGPWDIIQTWFGCGNGWVEQDGKLVPVHQTAEYKEALDWMRKIYADGLVRPDWATVDTANFQIDSQKGVTGVFVDTMDGTKRIWKYFEDNAIADVNDASKNATMTYVGPINGHTLATTGYGGFFLITKAGAKTEEDVKACLHFLDKMCDPEMMALADYGLKDICYDINADGKIVPNGKYDTTNCPHAGLNQAVPYVPYLTEQNPDYQLEKADYQLAYEESIANNVQYAVFNPALGYLTQSDTYAECGSDLVQILDDARTQYICGQIDEAGLQAAFDQWDVRGGTQVIEEVNALYAADKA